MFGDTHRTATVLSIADRSTPGCAALCMLYKVFCAALRLQCSLQLHDSTTETLSFACISDMMRAIQHLALNTPVKAADAKRRVHKTTRMYKMTFAFCIINSHHDAQCSTLSSCCLLVLHADYYVIILHCTSTQHFRYAKALMCP
jgi:hypothetical protein